MKKLNFSFFKILFVNVVLIIFTACSENDDNETIVDNDSDTGNTDQATFTDPRDGQIYKIVEIGNQTWYAENLRYAGNIPQVSGEDNWASIYNNGNSSGQAAWCYYDDNQTKGDTYGKLYNWYAVNTNTLCPSGWHLPTQTEWNELINYLGGMFYAGGKMKSREGWVEPNAIIVGEDSGFLALPGAARQFNGTFSIEGAGGAWWSSTPNSNESGWAISLLNSSTSVNGVFIDKAYGLSCRCLMD
jgi:uncharacterized protein (TIGR02145 family)